MTKQFMRKRSEELQRKVLEDYERVRARRFWRTAESVTTGDAEVDARLHKLAREQLGEEDGHYDKPPLERGRDYMQGKREADALAYQDRSTSDLLGMSRSGDMEARRELERRGAPSRYELLHPQPEDEGVRTVRRK
jgi:hypothetical protein